MLDHVSIFHEGWLTPILDISWRNGTHQTTVMERPQKAIVSVSTCPHCPRTWLSVRCSKHISLVVWNMNGWFFQFVMWVYQRVSGWWWLKPWNLDWLSIFFHRECHYPNWRTHSIIFQRDRSNTNQWFSVPIPGIPRSPPQLCGDGGGDGYTKDFGKMGPPRWNMVKSSINHGFSWFFLKFCHLYFDE